MQLRKFEAYGFKSFADRIELEYGPGITAIVGPNGSGKSNISDAIRWVLGEQNIRNLRGTKIEDIIFAGSAERRQLSVAEVSLIFDNSDGRLPIEYSEVKITRRVFRSGDGEFFINKTPCRLKDIHDLLADTGLGRDSMAVISQNKIDEFLNSRPEERRLIFEEAAGITKYKQRKKESLRKLDDTEQNLVRVRDIVSEIETQLPPMAENADKTRKYNTLAAKLKKCQVTLLLHKIENANAIVESTRTEYKALSETEVKIASGLSQLEAKNEALNKTLIDIDTSLKTKQDLMTQIKLDAERTESRKVVLQERLGQTGQAVKQLETELIGIQQEEEQWTQKCAELRDKVTEKLGSNKVLDDLLQQQRKQQEDAAAAVVQYEEKLESGKQLSFSHMQELVNERNNYRLVQRDMETAEHKLQHISEETQRIETELSSVQNENTSISAEKAAVISRRQQRENKISSLQKRKQDVSAQINAFLGIEKQLSGKLQNLSARQKILQGMQKDYEGFGRGIKSILKSSEGWKNGICGAVAEIINVPDKFVIAVEVALGGALQHIITDNEFIAKDAIQFLKKHHLGRVTFLPLTTVRPTKPRDIERQAAKFKGAFGFAADLVQYQDRFTPIINFLLGRVIIVEDIDAALAIAKHCSFGVKLVTLEGEVISSGGALSGGSTGRKEASFLSRKNEIEHVSQEIENIRLKIAENTQALNKYRDTMSEIEAAITAENQESQRDEVTWAELSVREEKVTNHINQLRYTYNTLNVENQQNQAEKTGLAKTLQEIGQKILNLEQRNKDFKEEVSIWQEELKTMQELKEEIAASLTETMVRKSALVQDISAAQENLSMWNSNLSRIKQQRKNKNEIMKDYREQIARAQHDLQIIETEKTQLAFRLSSAEDEYKAFYNQKMQAAVELQVIEKEIKQDRRQLTETQKHLHELELALAQNNYELNSALEQLESQYGLNSETAQPYVLAESSDTLIQFISELNTEIAAIGAVNPSAIEEYEQVKIRYEFLQKQVEDLIEAKQVLLAIIKDIDNTMSNRFNLAYTEINQYFGEIFIKLFGGGKASLQLTDPSNLLETGIEVFVQPAGKRQQNLALLSGGERALTVIALLFAILTYRPAPFCVLDEIDAALDEANVARFSDFISDYAENTQFIIVTHRKGTMEAANYMYGVTMEESGVSRLLSVQLGTQRS